MSSAMVLFMSSAIAHMSLRRISHNRLSVLLPNVGRLAAMDTMERTCNGKNFRELVPPPPQKGPREACHRPTPLSRVHVMHASTFVSSNVL